MLKRPLFPGSMPRLPQEEDCSRREKRQKQLERNRRAYQYDHAFWSPLPLLNTAHQGLPFAEWLTIPYLVTRILRTLKLPINQTIARIAAIWDRVDELQDYEDFFRILPKPPVIKTMQETQQTIPDEMFAEQRLSGPNPMVIRRLTEIPAEWGFTFQDLQTAIADASVNVAELAKNNLYVADYAMLAFVGGGSYQRNRQYLPAPRAFFYYRESPLHGQPRLAPLAIQMNPKRGKDGPFITPAHPVWSWNYAKLCVQVADANHHEMISHLCHTHLVMEPFAIATARQLGKNHPLGLLLRPHFRFLLANGELARSRLLGYIDRLLPGELTDSEELIRKGYEDWDFKAYAFLTEVANRGMMDEENTPHYPYRDDGQKLWNAIHDFVGNYLRLYYKTVDDIRDDTELQAWVKELAAEDGGRVKGLQNQIANVEELIEIVTNIIFTCGPQHSAVNYSQYDYMTYMPNMPLSLYQPVREDAHVQDRNSFMPFLPPRTQAAEQLAILYILSLPYYYDKLGHYKRPFADPAARKCVKEFQDNLKTIKNNCSYPYLNPNRITNSISM